MHDDAENLERAALEDLHAAAPPAVREGLGLDARAVATAFVSIASRLPPSAIVVNRALGMGIGGAESRAGVEAVLDAYRAARVSRFFIHLHPKARPDALPRWLADAGLERARGWRKFTREREPVVAPASALVAQPIGPEHGLAFGRIAADAFDLGEEAAEWIATLAGRPRWHLFMSFDADEPAGTGAMFVDDGLAWMDFGATAPRFRRRGGQALLLARRVQHALDLGCHRMYTCTGEDIPGDPQHSYRNILRAGFREHTLRANYAPPRQ